MNKLLLNYQPINIDTSSIVSSRSFLVYDGSIDLNNQAITIKMNLSSCLSTNENIISIGTNISGWNAGWNIHCYYSSSSRNFEIDLCTTSEFIRASTTISSSLTSSTTVVLTGSSIKVNTTTISSSSFSTSSSLTLSSFLTTLRSYSKIQIGSQEGNTRSRAGYTSMEIRMSLK